MKPETTDCDHCGTLLMEQSKNGIGPVIPSNRNNWPRLFRRPLQLCNECFAAFYENDAIIKARRRMLRHA